MFTVLGCVSRVPSFITRERESKSEGEGGKEERSIRNREGENDRRKGEREMGEGKEEDRGTTYRRNGVCSGYVVHDTTSCR